jgi:hypothetical protein
VGWIGTPHDLPLTLQSLDDDCSIRLLHDAAHDIAGRVFRRPAEGWHLSLSKRCSGIGTARRPTASMGETCSAGTRLSVRIEK